MKRNKGWVELPICKGDAGEIVLFDDPHNAWYPTNATIATCKLDPDSAYGKTYIAAKEAAAAAPAAGATASAAGATTAAAGATTPAAGAAATAATTAPAAATAAATPAAATTTPPATTSLATTNSLSR